MSKCRHCGHDSSRHNMAHNESICLVRDCGCQEFVRIPDRDHPIDEFEDTVGRVAGGM